MKSDFNHFSRYLPPDQQAREWGWRLVDAGRQTVPKEAPYPPPGHPTNYLFDDSGRRSLDEFQIILLTSGQGRFATRSMPERVVRAGQALILFPNEWHRYAPDPATGWTECWVGFRGREASRLTTQTVQPTDAVRPVARVDAVLQLFDRIFYWLGQDIRGKEQILASHLPLLLALVRSSDGPHGTTAGQEEDLVSRAKEAMLSQIDQPTDFEHLARELGTSYSSFRARFKTATGYAPRQFENLVRLNRAKDLLASAHLSVSQTAEALGFSSVYYFSRAFKKQFGLAPANWRKQWEEG